MWCFDWSHLFLCPSFATFFCSTRLSYNVSCSKNALLFYFFDLFLFGFPILGHASTSFPETLTSMSESTEITVSSKSLSETCPKIPETTSLFLLPSCHTAHALTKGSLDTISFSSLLHFSRNLLSFCSLLMAMSLSFIISFLRQFMVEIKFSFALSSASLLTTASFLVRVLYSWVITSVISEDIYRYI